MMMKRGMALGPARHRPGKLPRCVLPISRHMKTVIRPAHGNQFTHTNGLVVRRERRPERAGLLLPTKKMF